MTWLSRTFWTALLLLGAALLVYGVAAAQPPTAARRQLVRQHLDVPPGGVRSVSGETRYPPHSLVRLKAEGVDPKAAIIWRVTPKANVQRATTARNLLEFAAPPGTYEVEAFVISVNADGGIDTSEAGTTVVIESCHPPLPPEPPKPSPPPPGPNPPPPPQPGQGKLDPPGALGRIQFASAGCTATVVGPRREDGKWWVLTAAHCVSGVGARGTIVMPAGQRGNVRVVSHHRGQDLAWMVTEENNLGDLSYAFLADANPAVGTAVWHQGYGVDRPRNREDGNITVAENFQGQLQMQLSVSSGDSGGGIFRADDNRLVSVVCCTMGKGAKTAMWGGSVEQARKVRPATTDEPFFPNEWLPLEIPLVR